MNSVISDIQKARFVSGTGSLDFALAPIQACIAPARAAVLSAAVLLGSGGHLDVLLANKMLDAPTGARLNFGLASGRSHADAIKRTHEVMSDLRLAFGLNVTELEQILRVKRQTIYLWMNPDSVAKLQRKNRERLTTLHSFALEWIKLCSTSARPWLMARGADGRRSLFDRMRTKSLNVAALSKELRAYAAQAAERALTIKHTSRAERLRARGFETPPRDDRRARYLGPSVGSDLA